MWKLVQYKTWARMKKKIIINSTFLHIIGEKSRVLPFPKAFQGAPSEVLNS